MLALENNNLYIETKKPIFVLKKEQKYSGRDSSGEEGGSIMPRGGTISQRGFLICCEGVM
jgi:hypothetical protein